MKETVPQHRKQRSINERSRSRSPRDNNTFMSPFTQSSISNAMRSPQTQTMPSRPALDYNQHANHPYFCPELELLKSRKRSRSRSNSSLEKRQPVFGSEGSPNKDSFLREPSPPMRAPLPTSNRQSDGNELKRDFLNPNSAQRGRAGRPFAGKYHFSEDNDLPEDKEPHFNDPQLEVED